MFQKCQNIVAAPAVQAMQSTCSNEVYQFLKLYLIASATLILVQVQGSVYAKVT